VTKEGWARWRPWVNGRDHALLLFLYNSAARVSDVLSLVAADLALDDARLGALGPFRLAHSEAPALYVATIVVLITILQHDVSDTRLERLSQVVSIDRRTIAAERSRSKNNGGSIFRAASLSWPIEACLMSRLLARNAPLGFAASFCAVSAAVASRSRSGHPAPPPAWQ